MLQLTPIDNDIYCKFRAEFPEFAVGIVEESTLKSEDMKAVSITVDCIVFFKQFCIFASLFLFQDFYFVYSAEYVCTINNYSVILLA